MARYRITLVNGQDWITSDFEDPNVALSKESGYATSFTGIPADEDVRERKVIVRTEHISSFEEV